ncbi:MAG: hypothetical protein M0Z84_03975 [Gammaproteobacteria bacterium]|nr:hypothetical protein [Gammaproteobacteria bacterium]
MNNRRDPEQLADPLNMEGSPQEILMKSEKLKPLSPTFRDVRLQGLDPATLGEIAKAIVRDVSPRLGDSGKLIEYSWRDKTGREVSKFVGDIGSWMRPYMAKPRICRLNLRPGQRKETVTIPVGHHAVVVPDEPRNKR